MAITNKNGRHHLDIGCGAKPRNPYNCQHLYGVDIYKSKELPEDITFKTANLFISTIPYQDNLFDSISAYDFLEHVPRILADNKRGTRLPFIELMDEIWRVLKPNGILYAITPAYPHQDLF
jgi:SAM-dependent methyltransferase